MGDSSDASVSILKKKFQIFQNGYIGRGLLKIARGGESGEGVIFCSFKSHHPKINIKDWS